MIWHEQYLLKEAINPSLLGEAPTDVPEPVKPEPVEMKPVKPEAVSGQSGYEPTPSLYGGRIVAPTPKEAAARPAWYEVYLIKRAVEKDAGRLGAGLPEMINLFKGLVSGGASLAGSTAQSGAKAGLGVAKGLLAPKTYTVQEALAKLPVGVRASAQKLAPARFAEIAKRHGMTVAL